MSEDGEFGKHIIYINKPEPQDVFFLWKRIKEKRRWE